MTPKRTTTADWQAYWNERYGSEELVWGAAPNRFVAAELEDVAPSGRAVDLACGQGRNAIWLASRGWRVTGVDFSPVALARARRLATRAGVEVEWIQADVALWRSEPVYDLVLVAYLHLPPADWKRVLQSAAAALRSGALALLIGHADVNLERGWGGPQDPDLLWNPEALAAEMTARGLVVERADVVERPVHTDEGPRTALDTLVRAHRP